MFTKLTDSILSSIVQLTLLVKFTLLDLERLTNSVGVNTVIL